MLEAHRPSRGECELSSLRGPAALSPLLLLRLPPQPPPSRSLFLTPQLPISRSLTPTSRPPAPRSARRAAAAAAAKGDGGSAEAPAPGLRERFGARGACSARNRRRRAMLLGEPLRPAGRAAVRG